MKTMKINDKELDKMLKGLKSEDYVWENYKVKIDGVTHYRESIASDKRMTKPTAGSMIKKEPYFDFKCMDEIYPIIAAKSKYDAMQWPRPMSKRNKNARYVLDLKAAYPHVFKYEEFPIDCELTYEEDDGKMNFYLYHGDIIKDEAVITDDLMKYVGRDNCDYLFSMEKRRGSKIGDKLIEMVYKNKKTAAAAKEIHWGLFQRRYIKWSVDDGCFVRNRKNNKELLMIAALSQLTYIMLTIRDIIGDYEGHFVVDAYHWTNTTPDFAFVTQEIQRRFPDYDFRIFDKEKSTEIPIVQTYKEVPDAPRSHHKKTD